jgi:parvulin-like peptidyl-prolyl isomerase
MNSIFKKSIFACTTLILLGLAQVAFAHSGHKHEAGPTISLPEVVATVNKTEIKQEIIIQELKKAISAYKERGLPLSPDQEKTAAKKLIQDEIDRILIKQKGEELGITVSDDEVKAKIKEVRDGFKSDAVFGHTLANQGITLKGYAEQLREDIFLEKVIEQEVGKNVKVEEEEISHFYEENQDRFKTPEKRRASVILIKTPKSKGSEGEAAAKKKLDSIRTQVVNGAEFDDLAQRFSQDSLAKKGGDLGFFTATEMFSPFSSRAFKLKVGDVSEVFKTGHGYHLLKVTDEKPAEIKSLAEAHDEILSIFKRRKTGKATMDYLEELKKSATIKVYF